MKFAWEALVPMVAATLLAVSVATPPATADSTRAGRIEAAFSAWAERSGIRSGAIAVVENNRIVGSAGFGGTEPTEPEPIASDSKSITAMCILKLVEVGELGFDSRIGTLLPAYFAAHPPADLRARDITINALLTHTSGIGIDPTQGAPLQQFAPFDQPAAANQLAAALAAPLRKPTYAYNNVNYAALGLIIETVAAKPYEDHCRSTVLEPVGITDAVINPTWRTMGAFGGWELSAEDAARFLSYFDPRAGLVSTKPQHWPKVGLGGGASYSLGTLMRPAKGGFNFWHFGSWDWTGQPQASFGAYFARWSNGIGVAANYQPTITDAQSADLDASLWKAASGR